MKIIPDRRDVRVLGSNGNNSSKIVLDTLEPAKIKSKETP